MGKKKGKKKAEPQIPPRRVVALQQKLDETPRGTDTDDPLIAIRDMMVRVMDADVPRLGYIDRRAEDIEGRLVRVEVALISQAETLAALGRAVLDRE